MKFGSDFSGMLTYHFCKTFSNITVIETTLNYLINVALFLLIFAKISCATFISHAQLLFIFKNFECATFIRLRYICFTA